MFNVAVIGSGVIGLSTALAVQKDLGSTSKIIIFTDKLSPHTTGDVAAGLWMPYLLQKTPKEKVIQWSKSTQDYILKLWKQGEAKGAGISLQLITCLSEDENFQIPEWTKMSLGYNELPRDQVESYSQKAKEKYTGGFQFVSFIWEGAKFLPYFQKKFEERGGQIVMKTVESFDEFSDFDVIVNCTGLYSKFLVPDPLVQPVRGQVARVHAPWIFQTFIVDSAHGNYIIPNQNCTILGGTKQMGDFNTNIDEGDKKAILEGCYRHIPALERAPVIRHQAGLRPGREQVRVEFEERRIKGRIVKIVHNYGHGGSGVTLSIGCALEAAKLVKEALGFGGQSKL